MLKINVYVQKTKLFINRKKILCSFAVKLGSLLIENCAKWLLINYSCYKIIPQTRKASKFLKNCNYFFSIRWSLFILQSQCAKSNFLTKLGDLGKLKKFSRGGRGGSGQLATPLAWWSREVCLVYARAKLSNKQIWIFLRFFYQLFFNILKWISNICDIPCLFRCSEKSSVIPQCWRSPFFFDDEEEDIEVPPVQKVESESWTLNSFL